MKPVWIYILQCADGSYYTGITEQLERRVAEHQHGSGSAWTQGRLLVRLVFCQEMPDYDSAFLAERRLKGWSRAKKKALIDGRWDLVRWLAKKPAFRKE